jgi:hypothetical protein
VRLQKPSSGIDGGGRRKPAASLILAIVSLALAFGVATPQRATAASHCVDGSADEARVAGSDEGPPKFTAAFLRRKMTIDASTDGLDQDTLPISIESVCGLPRSLDKQAAQLAGGDGVALISTKTTVWQDGKRLPPSEKLVQLDGADTVTLRGRMAAQKSWKADEDGDPVPTFTASRITITD